MSGRPPARAALRREAPPDPAEAVAEGLDRAMIREVVHRFYARAREDEVIGPVFRAHVPDDRWQAHLDRIEAFWASALLRMRGYQGRPLAAHMGVAELEDAHFRRWLALFRLTAEEVCPPRAAALFIDRAERIAESFRVNLAMRRGDPLAFPPPLGRETLS